MRISDWSSDVCSSDLYVGWALIPNDAGQPGYIVAQVADITDRKRHEAEREEMTQMLQLAIEASGIGIWSYDFDTDKTTFDARMNELWGRPDDSPSITRETWLACIHRSEEHTSELQSLMRISYAVFCL